MTAQPERVEVTLREQVTSFLETILPMNRVGFDAVEEHTRRAERFAHHLLELPALANLIAERDAMREAKELLDMLQYECWDLRCFNIPTGGDDADVAWRVVGHWEAEPQERVIAEGYSDDPRVALRVADATTMLPKGSINDK